MKYCPGSEKSLKFSPILDCAHMLENIIFSGWVSQGLTFPSVESQEYHKKIVCDQW
jgi:hypothetical protein